MSFAITEPDAGTNTHRISTTATPDGDGGWTLSGQKYWTSAPDEADALLVVARGPEASPNGRHPLSLFIIEPDAPGITMHPIESVVMSPDKQFTMFFDNVKLGPEALVGVEGNGLKQVFVGLNTERVAVAAVNNGISCYAIDRASEYASDRQVWSKVIGAHQGVAHPLAEATIKVQQARLMTEKAAQLCDAGLTAEAGEAANMAKYAAAEAACDVVDRAVQTHGGNGASQEYGMAGLLVATRVGRIAPVSREMILNFIGERVLGLPRSF